MKPSPEPPSTPSPDPTVLRHTPLGDVQAIVIGTLLVALAIALILQERRGWRAGHVQMAVDVAIVAAALLTVSGERVAMSIVGAVALNLVLATNHRPGRYVAQ